MDFSRRFLYYFNTKYIANYVNKSIIYSALLKYGYKVFILEIIEYCDKENTISREQYYIDILKPKYNILKFAGSCLGLDIQKKTKAQMSLNNTKQTHPFFFFFYFLLRSKNEKTHLRVKSKNVACFNTS